MKVYRSAALAVMAVTLSMSMAAAGERKTLVVGAGEVTGFYYPAAGALCRVVNKERPGGVTCAVSPSSGSAANVEALRAGDTDFAILQSRAAEQAFAGGEGFKDPGAFAELRAVMSLHGEAVVVLAREGAGITTLADIKGKRVNLGRPGSFQRAMADLVLDAAGINEGELAPVVELDLAEQTPELCEGNIDVAFYSGVHPMPEVASAVEDCNATVLPVKAKSVDAFVAKTPWVSRAAIKPGTYAGVAGEVPSLAVRAVLATTTRADAETVQGVLRSVHANFPAFTRLHPVLLGLGKADSARDGIAIPLHDGAQRFYADTGLR